MTAPVCPSCDNWYGNHDPECVVATTIHAIWTATFSPDKAGTPAAWNQAIETILVDNAHRVAVALNGTPDHDDEARVKPTAITPAQLAEAQEFSEMAERIEVVRIPTDDALNGTPDLTEGLAPPAIERVPWWQVVADRRVLTGTSVPVNGVSWWGGTLMYVDSAGDHIAAVMSLAIGWDGTNTALVASPGTETDDAQ